MRIVGRIAVFTALFVYSLIAIGGYGLYGNAVTGNVLNSLPSENTYVFVANFGIVLVVLCSYPFAMFPFKAEGIALIEEYLTVRKLEREGKTRVTTEPKSESSSKAASELPIYEEEIGSITGSTGRVEEESDDSDTPLDVGYKKERSRSDSLKKIASVSAMDSLINDDSSTSDEEDEGDVIKLRRRSSAMDLVRKMSNAVKNSGLKTDEISIALDNNDDDDETVENQVEERVKLSSTVKFWYSIVAVIISTSLSLLSDNVEAVFGLAGSFLAAISVYIFPPAAYLLCGRQHSIATKVKCYLAISLGLVIGVFGTYTSIRSF
ncbi:hypothetical protein GEMRC1_003782 [Eukaryota sp. GEM-RC1]